MLYAVVEDGSRQHEIVTVYWGADVDSDSAATAEGRAGLSDSVEVGSTKNRSTTIVSVE